MLRIRHIGAMATLLLTLGANAKAQDRYLVTLRSGFTLEALQLEAGEDTIKLVLGDGAISFPADEVAELRVVTVPDLAEAPQTENGASPAEKVKPLDVATLIRQASERHGIPEEFVRSVAEAESALRTDARSPKGAQGVMQLMPDTAKALGVDANDPEQNIEGGAKLLRELLIRYQNDPDQVRLALAAYNAGQGAVKRHKGVPPYRETQQYIHRVLNRYERKTAVKKKSAGSTAPDTSAAGATQ